MEGARILHTQEVTGSSPVAPTIIFSHFQAVNSLKSYRNPPKF